MRRFLVTASVLLALAVAVEEPAFAEGQECWEPVDYDYQYVMGPQGFMCAFPNPTDGYRLFRQQRTRYVNVCVSYYEDQVRYMYVAQLGCFSSPEPEAWFWVPGCVNRECVCGSSDVC